jgi:hypothetical protein
MENERSVPGKVNCTQYDAYKNICAEPNTNFIFQLKMALHICKLNFTQSIDDSCMTNRQIQYEISITIQKKSPCCLVTNYFLYLKRSG